MGGSITKLLERGIQKLMNFLVLTFEVVVALDGYGNDGKVIKNNFVAINIGKLFYGVIENLGLLLFLLLLCYATGIVWSLVIPRSNPHKIGPMSPFC